MDLRRTRREHLSNLVGLAGIVIGVTVTPRETEAAQRPVPGISVWSIDGNLQKLSDFYGKPLLLNTYSPGCTPCVDGFPILNQLSSSIGVLGIFCDWGYDFTIDKAHLLEETRGHKMDFPSVVVTNRGERELDSFREKEMQQGGTKGYPGYYVLDSSGVCTHYQAGGLTFNGNEAHLRRAIEIGLR